MISKRPSHTRMDAIIKEVETRGYIGFEEELINRHHYDREVQKSYRAIFALLANQLDRDPYQKADEVDGPGNL